MSVIISGGGLVGLPLAIALAQKNIPVSIIDQQSLKAQLNPSFDGRTTSVSYGSKVIFEDLGIWSHVEKDAEPILHIRVYEEGSAWQVSYDAQLIGDHPMGYIVSNLSLRQAFLKRAQELSLITWYPESRIAETRSDAFHQYVTLDKGQELKASLLVSAEGRHSPLRNATGISQSSWTYPQSAFVCTVTHEVPHEGTAWEVFTDQGPLALLPLKECPETGLHRSGIALSWPTQNIQELMKADHSYISDFLTSKFRHYGQLKWVGERWSFPLSAMKLDRLVDHRFVIIGDAAHVVHPVAGQGVNLGWRDMAVLAKHLSEAAQLGQNLGNYTLLKRYEKQRQRDHRQMLQMTDGTIKLFSHPSSLAYFLRNTGLGLVEQLLPVKRMFMRHAMGISGQSPRLTSGNVA